MFSIDINSLVIGIVVGYLARKEIAYFVSRRFVPWGKKTANDNESV